MKHVNILLHAEKHQDFIRKPCYTIIPFINSHHNAFNYFFTEFTHLLCSFITISYKPAKAISTLQHKNNNDTIIQQILILVSHNINLNYSKMIKLNHTSCTLFLCLTPNIYHGQVRTECSISELILILSSQNVYTIISGSKKMNFIGLHTTDTSQVTEYY